MTDPMPTIAQTIAEIQSALQEYIEATYHVGNPAVIAQRKQLLESDGVIFQPPFIESTPRYQTGKRFADLDLGAAASGLFASLTDASGDSERLLFDPPYTHQARALEAVRSGRSLVVTTGTGSGKTETFLLPMLAKLATEAATRPATFAVPAVRALVLYPMNALVNDQLARLRRLLGDPRVTSQFQAWAGRPARFARYTSRTLYPGVRSVDKDRTRLKPIERFYIDLMNRASGADSPQQRRAKFLMDSLKVRGKWPAKPDLRSWYGEPNAHWLNRAGRFARAVLLPGDPELLTRHEVLQSPPDVLITNYSMLEYMMMRPLERPIFDQTRAWLAANPGERFLLIIDEAHLYRGAAGAEVALLLRRLRARLGISSDRLQVICTSASFDDAEYAREFAGQLSGTDKSGFETITGDKKYRDPAGPGSAQDAAVLASLPMPAFYAGTTDDARADAVQALLDYRGVERADGTKIGTLLYQALEFLHRWGISSISRWMKRNRLRLLAARSSPASSLRLQHGRSPRSPLSAVSPGWASAIPVCCRAACTPSSVGCPASGRAWIQTVRQWIEHRLAPDPSAVCTRNHARPVSAVRGCSSCTPAGNVALHMPAPTRMT